METPHHDVVRQVIAGCQQDHALVVRHVGLHGGVKLSGRQARFGVIDRLVKAITSEHAQFFEVCQVGEYRLGLHRQPKQAGVRRDNQII